MNLLDLAIIAIVAFGTWSGFRTGALLEIGRIVGLLLAFVLAVQLMDTAGLLIVSNFNMPDEFIPVVGFAAVFVAVMLVVFIAAKTVQFILGKIKLGGVNRLLGAAIGGFKWALVLSVAFLVTGSMPMPSQELRQGSAFYRGISSLAPSAWNAVAPALPSNIGELTDKLRLNSPEHEDPIEQLTTPGAPLAQ